MIIPSTLNDRESNNTKKSTSHNYDVITKGNLDVLDNMQIKREVYYKMNYIMKYLENHWAIKKRGKVFFFKNLETSSKEIITEDYLNRRIIDKLYTFPTDQRHLENDGGRESRESRGINQNPHKTKKDIIPLEDGIKTLIYIIENQKIDINNEIKNKIYVMNFVMNTLENGWTIRKKNDNFVFRKKHKNRDEVYSDDYLINFLKINVNY